MIYFMLSLLSINQCIAASSYPNINLASSPLIHETRDYPHTSTLETSSAGLTDERITPPYQPPTNKHTVELFAIPTIQFDIYKTALQKLGDRLMYLRKNNLVILKEFDESAINASAKFNKQVETYFDPIDVAFDKLLHITVHIEKRRKLKELLESMMTEVLIGVPNVNQNVYQKLSRNSKTFKLMRQYLVNPIEFAKKYNSTKAECHRIFSRCVKQATINYWYFAFKELFESKMKNLIETLQNSTFLSDEYGEGLFNKIHSNVQLANDLLENLWETSKEYYRVLDGGNDIPLNAQSSIHWLSRIARQLEAFKIELDVANIIQKWYDKAQHESIISVDVSYIGHSAGKLEKFLSLLGFHESNIKRYDVEISKVLKTTFDRSNSEVGLNIRAKINDWETDASAFYYD